MHATDTTRRGEAKACESPLGMRPKLAARESPWSQIAGGWSGVTRVTPVQCLLSLCDGGLITVAKESSSRLIDRPAPALPSPTHFTPNAPHPRPSERRQLSGLRNIRPLSVSIRRLPPDSFTRPPPWRLQPPAALPGLARRASSPPAPSATATTLLLPPRAPSPSIHKMYIPLQLHFFPLNYQTVLIVYFVCPHVIISVLFHFRSNIKTSCDTVMNFEQPTLRIVDEVDDVRSHVQKQSMNQQTTDVMNGPTIEVQE